MAANSYSQETRIAQAVQWLRQRLPATWVIEAPSLDPGSGERDLGSDGWIALRTPASSYVPIAVEWKESITPRAARELLSPLTRRLQERAGAPVLVVTPWLSANARKILRESKVNYIDLTGNALIQLENPALYIETEGARRNPAPADRGPARLRGRSAWRLFRTLLDVRPPYGVRELAGAAGVSAGYTSRVLQTLGAEALVERSPQGRVESVDPGGLLRIWADGYSLLKSNRAIPFATAKPLDALFEELSAEDVVGSVLVTGSFAARRYVSVAAPGMLTTYVRNTSQVAERLGLLGVESGGNVVLLEPFDDVVWERAENDDGIRYAAPSQVAVDCLTGNGRMPAEGEAMIEWLETHMDAWGYSSIERMRDEA